MSQLKVTGVQITVADHRDQPSGLLGYVSFTVGGALRFDGVTLRRTNAGRLSLSYPARRDRHGVDHPYIQPIDNEARVDIERQVFDALQTVPARESAS